MFMVEVRSPYGFYHGTILLNIEWIRHIVNQGGILVIVG